MGKPFIPWVITMVFSVRMDCDSNLPEAKLSYQLKSIFADFRWGWKFTHKHYRWKINIRTTPMHERRYVIAIDGVRWKRMWRDYVWSLSRSISFQTEFYWQRFWATKYKPWMKLRFQVKSQQIGCSLLSNACHQFNK